MRRVEKKWADGYFTRIIKTGEVLRIRHNPNLTTDMAVPKNLEQEYWPLLAWPNREQSIIEEIKSL